MVVYRFSVRRYGGPDDLEGVSIGVYETLGEAQRVVETQSEIAPAIGSAATFKVWQV